MRYFRFTAKNLGHERYLTYIMGEGMEVDEDVLDYCEENDLSEILDIIYEEDDDFDYLTYDITGKMSISNFSQGVMSRETVLKLLRNVALGMISVKEHAIPLSYILLNKDFMYIDPDSMEVQFLYLPVESDASLSSEFKSFVRQLVAGFVYNVEEDLAYVGQLLTYINGNGFNLRGLIGLTEALMKDAGIGYAAEEGISTDDGTEVVSDADLGEVKEKKAMDFMDELGTADEKLPEIGDDDSDELDEAEAAAENTTEEEAQTEAESIEEIKSKLNDIVNSDENKQADRNVGIQKPVRVSRAAVLKAAAEEIAEEDEKAGAEGEEESKDKKKDDKNNDSSAKDKDNVETAPKGKTEIIDNTILGREGAIVINPYLVRVNTDEKIVINKPVFKIGKASRGVDYHIGGNGAVSRQHAIILHKGNQFYIKDNKSTNHTYVDQKPVEGDDEVLLKNNCTITLGDEDFTFKIG
ncbi:MAG TPA: hypothetical protein DEO83_02060 [Lachnospiraceae bacterium]|nr:hypothetical protein [Lachnospiraceae bacterium]